MEMSPATIENIGEGFLCYQPRKKLLSCHGVALGLAGHEMHEDYGIWHHWTEVLEKASPTDN